MDSILLHLRNEIQDERASLFTKKKTELILKELKHLTNNFINDTISSNKNETISCEIFPFGSAVLECNLLNSDLDVVIFFPKGISRSYFFQKFPVYLANVLKIKIILLLEHVNIPIMKFKYKNLSIDLTTVHFHQDTVENLNIDNIGLLKNLDVKCLNTIHGLRLTRKLLSSIVNLDMYSICVSTAKIWAKGKGIYGGNYGFLNGASICIIMAYIMFNHQTLLAQQVLMEFFKIICFHKHPEPIEFPSKEMSLGTPIWNASNSYRDLGQALVVVSPSYPHGNCAQSVTPYNLEIIKHHCADGIGTLEKILTFNFRWAVLFSKIDFRYSYKTFVVFSLRVRQEQFVQVSQFIRCRILKFINVLKEQSTVLRASIVPETFGAKEEANSAIWLVGYDISIETYLNLPYLSKTFIQILQNEARILNIPSYELKTFQASQEEVSQMIVEERKFDKQMKIMKEDVKEFLENFGPADIDTICENFNILKVGDRYEILMDYLRKAGNIRYEKSTRLYSFN